MIELIFMIGVGLLLVRWLRPKPGELQHLLQPPPSPPLSLTIHIHGHVVVQPAGRTQTAERRTYPQGSGGGGLNSPAVSFD